MDPKIFHKLSYGLYVIGAGNNGKFNGQIANTVFQISSDPAVVAISINKDNLTHQFITEGKAFTVSVLPKSVPLSLIGHFGFKSGRDLDKYQSIPYKVGISGLPVLAENCLGYLEAKVINSVDVETHTVFFGRVIEAQVLNTEEEPLTYAYYHQMKKGKTPPSAPTYKKEETVIPSSGQEKQKYQCSICGYIYDPEIGDPDGGIQPGTDFNDIPGDWVCPICGVNKDKFVVT